jgi:hypothetical protein
VQSQVSDARRELDRRAGQSVGGGGGNGGFGATGTLALAGAGSGAVSVGLGGGGGAGGLAGTVQASSAGDVVTHGDTATGILAQSVGGGGGNGGFNVNVTITAAGAGSGAVGVGLGGSGAGGGNVHGRPDVANDVATWAAIQPRSLHSPSVVAAAPALQRDRAGSGAGTGSGAIGGLAAPEQVATALA